MSRIYTIEIAGHLRGKDRPRATRNGHHYTPHKTVVAENWVRHCALEQLGYDLVPSPAPVRLSVYAMVAIPQSWPTWKKEQAELGIILPTVKPDHDNCMKMVSDALNGVLWLDDKQVVRSLIEKWYGPVPKTTLHVEILD